MVIGGNIEAILMHSDGFTTNDIGERIPTWKDVQTLLGWLDYSGGDAKYTYDTKLQETTHIFICDYVPIDLKPEDKRLKINGNTYDVLMIDDPMGLHQQLEISLKFVG